MKKLLKIALIMSFFCLALSGCLSTSSDSNDDKEKYPFVINNASGIQITAVYVYPATSSDIGKNLLSENIPNIGSRTIGEFENGSYEAKIVPKGYNAMTHAFEIDDKGYQLTINN